MVEVTSPWRLPDLSTGDAAEGAYRSPGSRAPDTLQGPLGADPMPLELTVTAGALVALVSARGFGYPG